MKLNVPFNSIATYFMPALLYLIKVYWYIMVFLKTSVAFYQSANALWLLVDRKVLVE